MTHPSIADIPEHSLVERLMTDPEWRPSFVGIHGIYPNSDHLCKVPLDGLPGDPRGDVDILLTVAGQPDRATAIEVKRIKVGAPAFDPDGLPNKLQEFEEGVRQANLLASIGFFQVYLYVLVVVDSRGRNAGKISFDGLTSELHNLIAEVVSPMHLEPRVGLLRHDFVQSMDDKPLETGTYGGHLIRSARSAPQPPEVTAWVAQVMAARSA